MYNFTEAFPAFLKQDVEQACKYVNISIINSKHLGIREVNLKGDVLNLPYRIYYEPLSEYSMESLPKIQQTILRCLFTRHNDGYVRQAMLEKLLDNDEYFVIPFMLSLLGEYVNEILFVVDKHINIKKNEENYFYFIKENPDFFKLTQTRMISYWNEYHRKPKKNYYSKKEKIDNNYIGKRIFNKLDKIKEEKENTLF